MADSTRYRKGDKIGERYLVHQALKGGMGEVYLCLDLEQNMPFALKTFQSRFFTSSAARNLFKQEVSHWVALEKHPHIVRCFYMDTIANQSFMFLEWIVGDENHGTDLRSWLRSGPLSQGLALKFALDICFGLSYAQSKQPGIVHCDLKPDNILVAQGEVAKITDWGLATLVEQVRLELPGSGTFETGGRQSLRRVGGVAGTPPYMAPEQWRGEKLDVRTDLYAVGCILYEMLTGHWPYVATSAEGFEQVHLAAPIPSLPAGVPASVAAVVARCLAKEASERYGRPEELATVLQGIMQEELGQAVRVFPVGGMFDAKDHNNRGLTYANLGQYERAIQDLDQAIALEADNAVVYSNRGNIYHRMMFKEQALQDYDYAIFLNSGFADAYANRGITYDTLGQQERALQDYDRAIALQPDNATFFSNRGITYAALGQQERALQDYDRAIALKPDLEAAYCNRGNTYAALRQQERAIQDYDHAISLKPDSARAYCSRGLSYANVGLHERALQDYDRAIALKPDLAEAYCNRGNTYAALRQQERSNQDYNHAIALKPDFADAYTNRGNALYSMGLYEQALQDYDYAIFLKSDFAPAYANRGNTYAALRQQERALQDYDRAIALQPDLAEAYFNKGALLANTGALTEALTCFEKVECLGNALGPQYAALMRQKLGLPVSSRNPGQ